MIVAEQLSKGFGERLALDAASFRVAPGEVVGLLGPNGAGKTTAMRVLAGVFPPTSGRALVGGVDVGADGQRARRLLGYAPERPALHEEMTVTALLDFVAGLRLSAGARRRRSATQATLAELRLDALAGRQIRSLSKGVRQRVGLAAALVGSPVVLLLDEPTGGLDPGERREVRMLVRRLAESRAILVSSHDLHDVEAMCDRVVILHGGRVLAQDTPGTLGTRLRGAARIEIETRAPAEALAAALRSVPGVVRVALDPDATTTSRGVVETDGRRDVRSELAAVVIERGWALLRLADVPPSLEETFLSLVSEEP